MCVGGGVVTPFIAGGGVQTLKNPEITFYLPIIEY